MKRKRRSFSQISEEKSDVILRNILPEEWVLHNYGPDYGIDWVIELFDIVDQERSIAETLGEVIFVQLKSTSSPKYQTKNVFARSNVAKGPLTENKSDSLELEVISFDIEVSELLTVKAMGNALPVLLILVDLNSKEPYFLCLNDYIEKVLLPNDPLFFEKETKTIHIPVLNKITSNQINIVPLRCYGKRAKMYGAFTTFSFQKKEIERHLGVSAAPEKMPKTTFIAMIKTFTQTALGLDIWDSHDFWEPMMWSKRELTELAEVLEFEIPDNRYEDFLHGVQVTWHRLDNLSNMYEELVREWFMPTYLARISSYPV